MEVDRVKGKGRRNNNYGGQSEGYGSKSKRKGDKGYQKGKPDGKGKNKHGKRKSKKGYEKGKGKADDRSTAKERATNNAIHAANMGTLPGTAGKINKFVQFLKHDNAVFRRGFSAAIRSTRISNFFGSWKFHTGFQCVPTAIAWTAANSVITISSCQNCRRRCR
jgi:hypothetical protein